MSTENELGGGWDEGETENHFIKARGDKWSGDSRLKEDALEILFRDPEIISSNISIEVENHVLTLRGHVRSQHTKDNAEKALENLSGVDEVRNELQVM